jgi:hypothetical protein
MTNEVEIIVRFPEQHYKAMKGDLPAEFTATGKGETVSTALHRAFKSIMTGPMQRKSPNWAYISVGMHGMHAIRFWDHVKMEQKEDQHQKS